LKQIFGNDHEYINLSDLADLVLSQPLLGSSVKVQSEDPKKEDPYAMLSVLNMQEHKVKKNNFHTLLENNKFNI